MYPSLSDPKFFRVLSDGSGASLLIIGPLSDSSPTTTTTTTTDTTYLGMHQGVFLLRKGTT
jgi:hypothetical protein